MTSKNPALQKFAQIVFKTALYSALVNVLLFISLQQLGVIHAAIFMQADPTHPLVAVILSSVLPTLVGGIFCWLLVKYLKNGLTIFSVSVMLLGFLSFAAPFSLPGIPIGMALALNLMHVVVMYNMLFFYRRAVKKTVVFGL